MPIYPLIPAICMILGALLAALYAPSPSLRSATQHFAAGVVFAAVSIELLPLLSQSPHALPIAIGFLLGIFSMLLGKWVTHSALLTAVGTDITIDGLLIGIAFAAGERGGVLITIALATEIFFLGLVSSLSLKGAPGKKFLTIACLSLLIPTGYLMATTLLPLMPHAVFIGAIAFGVAALLYLVTEELLKEAHAVPDKLWITALFFIGFLVIILLDKK